MNSQTVQQIINESGFTVEQVKAYLDRLRESGICNMFSSGSSLGCRFGFNRREQEAIVLQYMDDGLQC